MDLVLYLGASYIMNWVSNFKCHKLESCSSKNMLVEKLDEETSDLVYDDSNGSEEVS